MNNPLPSQQRGLLAGMARSVLAGAAGGSLAALVVGCTLQIQGWIWGATVQRGLPSDRSLFWCLLWCGAIGVALSLLQRRHACSSLPELQDTLSELRQRGPTCRRSLA